MRRILIGAALVAVQLASPAAGDPDTTRRDIMVKVSDLDLGTADGVAKLDRRLTRAVVKVCGTAHYLDEEGLADMERCRADARERVMVKRLAMLGVEADGAAPHGAAR